MPLFAYSWHAFCANSGVEQYKFWRGAIQILAWSRSILAWSYQILAWGSRNSIMLRRYNIWLHTACTYAAQVQHMAA